MNFAPIYHSPVFEPAAMNPLRRALDIVRKIEGHPPVLLSRTCPHRALTDLWIARIMYRPNLEATALCVGAAGRVLELMTKEDDYLQSAADAMELVRRASSNEDKGRLLKLAQAWLDLADHACNAARLVRQPNLAEPSQTERA